MTWDSLTYTTKVLYPCSDTQPATPGFIKRLLRNGAKPCHPTPALVLSKDLKRQYI